MKRRWNVKTLWSSLFFVALCALSGCSGCSLSFRGGSVPAHLHTITIPVAEDVSGSGIGTLRQDLTNLLIRRFSDDNSLRPVDPSSADSRLDVTISQVRRDVRLAVTTGELESVREVLVEAKVTFHDNVKKRDIFTDRTFIGRSQYQISGGVAAQNTAFNDALAKLTDLILVSVVADW